MCMSPLYMKNTSEQWLQHNIGGIFLNSIINLYLKFNFKWFFFPFPIGSLQWLICYWQWISVVFSNMAGSFAFINLKQIRANILQHSYDSDVWNFHKIRVALFFTTLRIFRKKKKNMKTCISCINRNAKIAWICGDELWEHKGTEEILLLVSAKLKGFKVEKTHQSPFGKLHQSHFEYGKKNPQIMLQG